MGEVYRVNRKIIKVFFDSDKGREIHALIDFYRKLLSKTWDQFTMEAICEYIGKENEMLAEAIRLYIDEEVAHRKKGRPVGYKKTPKEIKRHSDVMKAYWKARKEEEAQNEG